MKIILFITGMVCLVFFSGMMVSCDAGADDQDDPQIILPGIDYRKPAVPVERIPPPPILVPGQEPPVVADKKSKANPAVGAHKYPESADYRLPDTAPSSSRGPVPAAQGQEPKKQDQSGHKPTFAGAVSIIEALLNRPVEDVIADNTPAILESVLGEKKAEVFMEKAPVIVDTIDRIIAQTEEGSDPLESIMQNLPAVIEGVSKPSKTSPGSDRKEKTICDSPVAQAVGGYILRKIFESPGILELKCLG